MFVINSVVADARVIREAASLAAGGHEVFVVAMREGTQPARDRLEGFTVVRVRRDPVRRSITMAAPPHGPVARALEPLALAWGLVDYTVRGFRQGLGLDADVYHAHDLVTLPVAWAAARARRARLIYDAHELFTEMGRLGPLTRAVFRILERTLIGRADRVITVNLSIAAELSRRYNVPAPTVIMNFPRTGGGRCSRERSPLRSYLGIGREVPLVLYQGMFMPHRGLENLVRAARSFSRAHLVMMGWGALLDPLRELVRREGLEGRVHFAEGVPLGELLSYTAGADVGAIPYRNVGLNNYYTSPNKLFEYCAAAVPVVASRFPELVKVVEGLGIGLTFDPECPEDIARAVNALLDDPATLARARANVARAAAGFSWESESAKLIEVYRAVGAAPQAARQ
jgi:glycosyltransferase involved in cell wall biosynthesis